MAPAPFLSRPDLPELAPDGVAIVVEGSKKAAVTCIYLNDSPQVIGVPSCNSWAGVDKALITRAELVYVVLDPDAQAWAYRKAAIIGKAARIVTLPSKIDDAFTKQGLTEDILRSLFRQARKQQT